MSIENPIADTARDIVRPGLGILAADESVGTMTRRLEPIGVESTLATRSLWREIMLTTPGIEAYISGVILFDETLRQPTTEGIMLADLLKSRGIHPGIKVDKGTVKLPNLPGETFTQGLDDLGKRLKEYGEMGADFTKWRAVYKVGVETPSPVTIMANSIGLAEYAALTQEAGLMPIIEPEVLVLEGDHDISRSQQVTQQVLKDVFAWQKQFGVQLGGILLKPNMVLPGKNCPNQATPKQIACATVETLLRVVPPEVPGIIFLSGGLTPNQATEYLAVMNSMYAGKVPWKLSFSFGRALQQEALQAYGGKDENIPVTQQVFLARAQKVSAARLRGK